MAGSGTARDPENDSAPYRVDLDQGAQADGDDLRFGPLMFYRHRSPDGLLPQIVDAGDGGPKAVRLAVRAGAYPGPLDDPSDCGNDRCELRGPKQKLGVDVWHGFSIRVPADFPIRPLRCVVAQMKMPYDSGGDGSPAFALRIDMGRWLVTVEHLYDQNDKAAGRYLSPPAGACPNGGAPAFDHSNFNKYAALTDYQVRAFVAADADGLPAHVRDDEITNCTTGVQVTPGQPLPLLRPGGGWTDFMVHIQSSGRRDVAGVIEVFADGAFVAGATGEFGYPHLEDPPVQYFKVGLYRNNDPLWGKDMAALDYRNICRASTRAGIEAAIS